MNKEADAIYIVPDSVRERQRLQEQGKILKPFTLRLFHDAGICEGMYVLDVGSGAGDVAFAAAELVGPTGSVVGVDSNPDVLETARERAATLGHNNITFHEGDIRTIELDGPFDAVVGRLVLMYLNDPAEAIRKLLPLLRPDGIIAFLEPDLSNGMTTIPHSTYHAQLAHWLRETFKRAGVESQMGLKLWHTYINAGLPDPKMQYNALMGGGHAWDIYRYYENTMRSMLPIMERLGVTTAAELDVDTIAERLHAEIVRLEAILMASCWVGAWSRKNS